MWTQEAHRPSCSKSLVGGVPILAWGTHLCWGYVPWPRGTYLGQGGTYLGQGAPTLAGGYLPWLGGTYLAWGVPTLVGDSYLGQGTTYHGLGTPLGVDRQTPVKTVPSPILRMWVVNIRKWLAPHIQQVNGHDEFFRTFDNWLIPHVQWKFNNLLKWGSGEIACKNMDQIPYPINEATHTIYQTCMQ